jgi:hypothetical protein
MTPESTLHHTCPSPMSLKGPNINRAKYSTVQPVNTYAPSTNAVAHEARQSNKTTYPAIDPSPPLTPCPATKHNPTLITKLRNAQAISIEPT